MSEPIQSISQGNYILQGTVATSAGIVGDGSTQNPLRADETVLFSAAGGTSAVTLSEPFTNFESIKIYRNGHSCADEWYDLSAGHEFRFLQMYGNNAQATFKCAMVQASAVDSTHITVMNTKTLNYNFTATSTQANGVTNNDTYAKNIITRVVGINRKAQ